jgi:DNA-binding transcriptional ArsR family regulator
VAETGLSQSNTSNHLRCLSECGLISGKQRGRFVLYSLTDPRIRMLLQLADELLSSVAQGVDQCANYENGSST